MWLVGVVSRRWNWWMWLVGVVVRKHIGFLILLILLIPTPLVLALFAAASLLLCSFLNGFFRSCLCYFLQ